MSQTNIEYFNSNLKLFINNILEFYPDYKESIEEYYRDVLDNESCNDDKYIKRFMRKFGDCKTQISSKDCELFKENIFILKNIDFKEIWDNEKTTDKNRDVIWDYLQTLYVIGETIMSDSDRIKKLVENFKKVRNNEEIGENKDDENKEIYDMIKTLSEKQAEQAEAADASNDATSTGGIDTSMLDNGLIGSLARELAEDINMDDMNLIQNVGQKIQTKLADGNIDQSKLVEEAQNMMGMLGNNNPMFDGLLKNAKKEMEKGTIQPPKNTSHNNPTRDRLRKKLEERKNKE